MRVNTPASALRHMTEYSLLRVREDVLNATAPDAIAGARREDSQKGDDASTEAKVDIARHALSVVELAVHGVDDFLSVELVQDYGTMARRHFWSGTRSCMRPRAAAVRASPLWRSAGKTPTHYLMILFNTSRKTALGQTWPDALSNLAPAAPKTPPKYAPASIFRAPFQVMPPRPVRQMQQLGEHCYRICSRRLARQHS